MKKLFLFVLLSWSISVNAQQKPNMVIIISDDHAYQTIGAYGSKLMETPNIDRIAREGAVFDKATSPTLSVGPAERLFLPENTAIKTVSRTMRPQILTPARICS